jgi:hypothetical protein
MEDGRGDVRPTTGFAEVVDVSLARVGPDAMCGTAPFLSESGGADTDVVDLVG